MLRQLAANGFRGVLSNTAQLPTSLGAAATRELSGQGYWGEQPAASSPRQEEAAVSLGSSSCALNQGLQRLPPRPTARLEIWRNGATATVAAMAPRPAVFSASITSGKTKSAERKASISDQSTKSTAAQKAKATRATKTSRASGTARGRAAAERRRVGTEERVKKARAGAKAKAEALAKKLKAQRQTAVSMVKAKAAESKAQAVARVKAEAKKKLQAALERAKAKAAEQIARLEAKKDAARVKRAPTALNIYVREQIKANPQLTLKDASLRFKEMRAEEKQKYVEQATAAKVEVQQERRRLTAERAARRATPAYMFFATKQRSVLVAANPNMSLPETSKRLGEIWRGMSAEQRKKYVDMAEADRKAKGLDAEAAAPAKAASAPTAGTAASAQPQQA